MNPEIERHLKRANELLLHSQSHLHNEFYDDSINRSYYAMYHAVTGLMLTENVVRKKHSGLIAEFNMLFVKTGKFDKRFGRALQNGFVLRNDNDYMSAPENNIEDASELLNDARDFVNACSESCRQLS